MLLVINNYVKLLNVCMVVFFYITKINGVFFVKQINLVKYY